MPADHLDLRGAVAELFPVHTPERVREATVHDGVVEVRKIETSSLAGGRSPCLHPTELRRSCRQRRRTPRAWHRSYSRRPRSTGRIGVRG